jgi:hypothetical protein
MPVKAGLQNYLGKLDFPSTLLRTVSLSNHHLRWNDGKRLFTNPSSLNNEHKKFLRSILGESGVLQN